MSTSSDSFTEQCNRWFGALDAGRVGIWEWNAISDELVGSPGLETIRGRQADRFRGSLEQFLEDIHAEDRDRVRQAIEQTARLGGEYHVEYRVLWPDGSQHWIENRGKPLRDGEGKPAGVTAVSLAIDRQKGLEEELRGRVEQIAQSEARVRSIVDNVIDGIVTIDGRGTILSVNPAVERLFGYTAEELLDKNVSVLMPQPYRSQHDRYLENYLRTGQAKIIGIGREVIGRRKDGSTFPMDLGVSEFRLDGRPYFTGIVRDITERKRTENIAHFLADASRSLAALVDYASTLQKVSYLAVPFFAEWCTVHVAEAAGTVRQLAAAHIEPAKAQIIHDLGRKHPLDPQSPAGPARILATGQAELTGEITDDLMLGLCPSEEACKALRDFGLQSYMGVPLAVRGKTFGVLSFYSADPRRKYDSLDLAVAEDLAHRASIAIENALLYGELRDADRRKDEFLAMLAHELRNPLAPIRSGLDLFAVSGYEPEVAKVMQQQVEHLVRMVDDLLDVARIMRGRIELRPEIVNARDVVQRAIDAMQPSLHAADQQLHVSLPQKPILLHADPVRLTQVVANLLSNASKYGRRGGNIWISLEQEGRGAQIAVRDDGIGIDEELLPHVFDLFAQADRSLERTQGGLGIGLTLVRTLVEMHHGNVSVHSEGPGRGSEFSVRLPVYVGSHSPEAGSPLPISSKAHRILVVEDNVGTAKILARLLSKLGGHDIQMVHDGLSALEAAKAYHPEIVLLDIGLPRMNGYEVARRLRQQPEFHDLVLVALTGYGTDEDRRRSAEVGFDRHLVKPPSLENLRQVLADPKLASR